ncbi:hypothetical protein HZA96_03250 [Candidatus Woesearchaeota archaeon]|nr:hypothetical protein [Candidatus Woesearchaeota archaeon]
MVENMGGEVEKALEEEYQHMSQVYHKSHRNMMLINSLFILFVIIEVLVIKSIKFFFLTLFLTVVIYMFVRIWAMN